MMQRLSDAWAAFVSWVRNVGKYRQRIREAKRSRKTSQRAIRRSRWEVERADAEVDKLKERLSESEQRVAMLAGENEVLKSQIDLHIGLDGRLRARIDADTAMQVALKVGALRNTYQSPEELG